MKEYSSKRGKFYPGVYIITCLSSKKFYIGSASYSVFTRIRSHQVALERGKHSNLLLQNAYNKYGKDNFTFERLESCEQNKVIEREQYWIDLLQTSDREHGFNINPVAGSNLGYKFTEEQKLKISKTHKEKGVGVGNKNARFGVKISEEQKIKTKKTWVETGFIKPIYIIDCNLNKLIFNSFKDAADYIGCDKALVAKTANGKYKTSKGYAICFIQDLEITLEKIRNNKNYFNRTPKGVLKTNTKKVKVTDKITNEQFIFNSAYTASVELKINSAFVYNILNNKKNSKKYKFEYL